MFDIDGTLVQSCDFDSGCFIDAVKTNTGIEINSNWSRYTHVTDSGILNEVIASSAILEKEHVYTEVKNTFIENIERHIRQNPVKEIQGASSFIAKLNSRKDIVISFATGGWLESAQLKLKSVGINFTNIPIASSDDHYKRTEIMKVACKMASKNRDLPCTYFGDESWDKKACEELNINFVLVGNKIKHSQVIKDFREINKVMAYIGLRS